MPQFARFGVSGISGVCSLAAGNETVLAEAVCVIPFFVIDGLICLAVGCATYLPKSIRALDADTGSDRR